MDRKMGILERLAAGPVIGDGGMVMELERRGYVVAGHWTPEATVEHPEAVTQLHREFARAGSDVLQTFSFYASDAALQKIGVHASVEDINNAACKLVKDVASQNNCLVAGCFSQSNRYKKGEDCKEAAQREFQTQIDVFVKNQVDFIIVEFFQHVDEIEWAIESVKKTGLPVAAMMCIGCTGDLNGVPPGECAVRMARAGASLVGTNCHFDPFVTLKCLKIMKEALEEENLNPYLMCQPVGYRVPDGANTPGYYTLPEFPLAMEPRQCTRYDIHKFAREAFELGVRYIGGCCGFEPFHIRAIAEELAKERGRKPEVSKRSSEWGEHLKDSFFPELRPRSNKDYWMNLKPSSGLD